MTTDRVDMRHDEGSKKMHEAKPYLVPFSVVTKTLGLEGTSLPEEMTVTKDQLRRLITTLLRAAAFDEEWYLAKYPDIADAVALGKLQGAREHFTENGYFEGRLSGRVIVDEHWYQTKYPDVAEGIELGEIASCQQHFETHGRVEGRLPHPT